MPACGIFKNIDGLDFKMDLTCVVSHIAFLSVVF